MSKFKLRLKLTGLEIEVEGDREHAPELANNISRQLSNVIQPGALIEAQEEPVHVERVVEAANNSKPRRRKSSAAKSATTDSSASGVFDWTHDATKWGTPIQGWKGPKKIAWLLYVIGEAQGKPAEMTPTEIQQTYDAKFRSTGTLKRGNIPRDLANRPEQFGELSGRWFLKDKGREEAKKSVQEALGNSSSAATA